MPAYNEEGNVESSILHSQSTFDSFGLDYEIIIIDDKSTDRTAEIARGLANQYPQVSFFQNERNLGAGGAFQVGIKKATKDYVIFVPFDNPLEAEDLGKYLPRMEVCDIVVGARSERVGYSRFAKFASYVYNRIMIPLLFNLGIADVNWIQAYRRSIFSEGLVQFQNSRIFFLVEILVLARRNGLIIAEVPSTMKRRLYGDPTCSRFSTMFITLLDAIRFFIRIKKEESGK
jgi:glycosyltransferase involved in cell wall biosynthesis